MSEKVKICLVGLHSKELPVLADSYGVLALSGYLKEIYKDKVDILILDSQLHSENDIIAEIRNFEPRVLGFSVKLGTFNYLRYLFNKITGLTNEKNSPIYVFGNVIPTYAPEIFLSHFPSGLVCIGEGEPVLEGLIKYINNECTLDQIDNIAYLNDGTMIRTQLKLIDPDQITSRPDRSLAKAVAEKGGQIYLESSRGCPWGKCTFCAIRDKINSDFGARRWRALPVENVVEHIEYLADLPIKDTEFIFIDEEFVGHGPEGLKRAKLFAQSLTERNINIEYAFSTRVDAVYNEKDTPELRAEREQTFELLVRSGLRSVFLGIESGSDTQRRRYAKGNTVHEAEKSVEILKNLGVRVEIGFMIFDPLMTLDELKENIHFLERNNLIGKLSTIPTELRVQLGAKYIDMIRNREKKYSVNILGDLDPDSLSYAIRRYQNENAGKIFDIIINWWKQGFPFYYAVKVKMRALPNNSTRKKLIQTMVSLQTVEVNFIKKLTEFAEQDSLTEENILTIKNRCENSRQELYRGFLSQVASDDSLDPEKTLANEINSYLDKYQRKVCANQGTKRI